MGDIVALECSNCEVEMEEVLGTGLAISRQIYSCMPCRALTVMAIGVEHARLTEHPEDDYLDCVGCGEPMLPLWPPPPGRDVLGRCPVCRAGELTLVAHLTSPPTRDRDAIRSGLASNAGCSGHAHRVHAFGATRDLAGQVAAPAE